MKTKEKIYSKKSVSITREKLMYLIHSNPLLVNGDLDEDNENYILSISSDGYLNFEDIKNEPKADVFRLLINCAQLHTLCSEFSFSLNPENIAFDINLNPKIIDRDLPDENNDFVSEYKALIGCVLYPKYTFDDYFSGGKDLYKKKKLLKKLKEIDNTEAIKEELMQEYCKIIKDVKENKILVSKKSRTAFKIAIPIMATLTVAIGVVGSYLFFVHTPYQKKLTFAANAYIAENYINVQNELSEIKLDRIPAEQKYILARSFVITEALTNEQKENILNSITLKTDERVLSYWIELGRLNFDEAIDSAKQLGDDQLLLFSLIKKNAAVKSDTQIKALDIINGGKRDPTFYPVIYGAAAEDDWTDPKVWKKANPSLSITAGMDKVKAAFESARQNPAEENSFRQLRLNQWVKQAIRWMPMDKWDKCNFAFDIESLRGSVCYGGLDLSSSTDITAFVLVFPPIDEDDKYIILPYFWLPEETLDLRVRRDHVNYDVWEKQGFLQTTEGNVVHYGFIESFIEELGKVYNIREIAFDRWGAVQMTQNLENLGFTVVPFGQGFKDMSPPTKELMKLTLEEKIAHGGHPVLRWMMDNIYIRTDPAGNIKADKEKPTEKIDGAVATIMALDRAIRCGGESGASVYNERGLLIL